MQTRRQDSSFSCRSRRRPTEGCHFKDLFPASQADRVLTSGVPSYHRACTNGNHRLLVSEVPVNSQTGSHAVLTIINDQTDMETVMDELTRSKGDAGHTEGF